jgi:hypothetical protein
MLEFDKIDIPKIAINKIYVLFWNKCKTEHISKKS